MISRESIDEAFSDLWSVCGGVREDYFGLLYLEREHQVPRNKAINQIAFGGDNRGFDGFHFDAARRNMYIFQFQYAPSPASLEEPLRRLVEGGVEDIFQPTPTDAENDVLLRLRGCLAESRELVRKLCFRLVFAGNPYEAECSEALARLCNNLMSKEYLMTRFFSGRHVKITVDFRSSNWGAVTPSP
jgi:hypothetical protein